MDELKLLRQLWAAAKSDAEIMYGELTRLRDRENQLRMEVVELETRLVKEYLSGSY